MRGRPCSPGHGTGSESALGRWLLAVITVDLVSLFVDAVDVVRYAIGDCQLTLTLEDLE